MQQINWGIIGPGSIASAFAYSIQGASNSKLISVYGRSKDKTKTFANKFEIAAHHDLTEFIKDAKIDAVYIATPHSCLLYTSPSPRDVEESRMPSSA